MKLKSDLVFAWALTALIILLVLGLGQKMTVSGKQARQEIVLPDIFIGK